MASEIFKNILEQKIDVFASTFGDVANNIFTRKDKIFHPLEYGMYKERAAKELLMYTSNKSINISDGFLITSNNSVSTQCDIVMYKNNTIPLIDNGICKFFPIEIVKGIGEVKSTLDKTEFSDALIKLSKNKMLLEERSKSSITQLNKFDECNEIFTFLICNKLSFNFTEIDFDEVYKDISEVKYRHNVILSLHDGFFSYKLTDTDVLKKFASIIKGSELKNDDAIIWDFPHHIVDEADYKCDNHFIEINMDDEYNHIIQFLISINSLLDKINEYEFSFASYLTSDII